jgi:hypothetical protein
MRDADDGAASASLALSVACVMDFHAFWDQALTALTAAAADDIATVFGFHASAKAELAFAGALGWLVGPFGAHEDEE